MSRILLMSDVHYCEPVWYGVTSDTRMAHMIEALRNEYEKDPFDLLLMLGDYSLDFWMYPPYGSVLNRGISFLEKFMREVYPQLPPCPKYMIPGNHEQYGEENWYRLTGFRRYTAVPYGRNLFILLDNFAANLDPTENSDGTYTPSDVAYIREQMAVYPSDHVFLCAHEFIPEKESEEFKMLVKQDDRIVALFAGHTHLSDIIPLGEAFGNKYLIRDGQFSYSKDLPHSCWGWREIRFEPDGRITTAYITPDSDLIPDGRPLHHKGGRQDEKVLFET